MFRLAIGTAQFGMNYGITNRSGVPDEDQLAQILDWAIAHGISNLDTASAYGDAHQRLGKFGVRGFCVVSKLPARIEPYAMEACLTKILTQLNCDKLSGLLLHSQEDLLDAHADARFAQLQHLKETGLIEHIGISVYDGDALLDISKRYSVDMVQCPINPLNRSCESALHWLAENQPHTKVQLRSIFLQGALLSIPELLPQQLRDLRLGVTQFQGWCRHQNVDPGIAALSYLKRFEPDAVVVGVNRLPELQEIVVWHEVAAEVSCDPPAFSLSAEYDARSW